MKRIFITINLVAFLAILNTCLQAQTTITSATSGNWNVAATWSGGVVPVAGNNVTIAAGHTVTLVANTDITTGSLTVTGTLALAGFDFTAGSLAGGGNIGSTSGTPTISVGSNNSNTTHSGALSGSLALTKTGTGTLTLTNANTQTGITTIYGGAISINADNRLGTAPGSATPGNVVLDGGTLITTNNFTLNANRGITLGGGGGTISTINTTTYQGVIDGTGALTKAGAGTLILSGTNTYTGITTLNAGTLSIAADNALSTAPLAATPGHLVLNGGTLATTATFTLDANRGISLDNSGGALSPGSTFTLSYGGIIAGGGAFTKAGAGTLILSGTNTYTGNTTISGGTLSISADNNLGAAPISPTAGQLVFTGTTGVLNTSTTFTLDANRGISFGAGVIGTIDTDNGTTLTCDGVMAGTGSLSKLGTGMLTLSGTNTYTGATNISAGTLQLGTSSERISNSSALTVASGATFDMNGLSETVGSLAGAGTVTSGAAGSVTLTHAGNGSTTFSGLIENGSGTVALTKAGTGILTLSGTNTYSGITTLNAGTLSIAADNALGTAPLAATPGHLVLNGGTLATTATFTLDANRGISLGNSGGALSPGSTFTLSYGGIIAGSGAFTKAGAGTLILSGTNTYTGITTISGGTLSIDDDIRLGAPPVSATAGRLMFGGGTLGTTATFTLNANRGIGFSAGNIAINTSAGTTLTYGGVMASSNTGSTLVKTGTGRLTLSGANTNLGGTTISEGTIQLGASNVIPDRGLTVNGTLDLNGFNETVRSLSGSGLITTSVAGSVTFTPGVSGYSVSTTFSGIIEDGSGTMNLTVNGGNGLNLTLTGDNTYTGITTLIGGNLLIDSDNRMGPPPATVVANKLILDGGTLVTTATFTLHENRGITMGNSAGTINTSPGTTLTYQGIISGGTGSFIKEGSGTLILSGANTYTGATTIDILGGTLKLGTSGAIPDASALTVGNSSTFDLAGFSETVGSLAGHGTVSSSAAGTPTLTAGGDNTSTAFHGIMQNGSATSVALTKNGTGRLTLSGANTYTGITTISGGEISINADTRLGAEPPIATQGHLLLDGGTLITTGTFTLSANRGITLGSSGGAIYTATGNSTLTYGGNIDGSGSLTKNGVSTGILILSGVNSYTGATAVSSGTLRLGAAGIIPDASALTVTGTFDLAGFSETVASLAGAGTVTSSAAGTPTLTAGDDNTSTTFSGTIQNGSATSVALTKNGTGTLTLTGANTYTGETSISAGTLSIGAGSTTGAISNSSNVTNNAALIVNRAHAYSYAGVISGTGSVTKQGAGTFTISGANTYTGATTISVGTLQLSTASERISNSSALTVAGGATFDLAGFSETVGSLAGAGTVSSSAAGTPTLTAGANNTSTTFSGIMQNGSATSVDLTKNGTGTLTLTGANTYTGSTTINGGTLSIGDGGTTGIVPGNITNDAALIFNRSNSLTYSGVISGIGTVTKQGNGTLTLTGANSYTGETNISAGTLSIGAGSTTGAISNSSNVTNNAALIVNRSDAYTYSGVISGSGSLTKQGAGTFTISGANTYTGATTISVGTLQLSTANERISNSSALTVAGGATFDLAGFSETVGSLAGAGTVSSSAAGTPTLTAGGDNTSTTFSGIMQNGSATSVDLTKNGTGTLTLTGANTYTGTTTISAGTLSIGDGGTTGLVAGNITNDATLIFNRSNSLTFSGVISGIGAVTKQGNGMLTLTGANSYTGETSISAGTLRLGDNEVIPDASDVVLTGMLDMNGFNETINGINFDGPSILVVLNASNITVNGAVTGAGSGSYFQTNGTGSVKRTVTNGETFSFPVGNSAYNPLSITNNTGTAEWFSARVRDEVYEYGTFGEVLTQPRVKRTWDIGKETPNAFAGGGVDFVFNWNSGEVSNPAPATYALFHHDANGNGWAEVVIGTGSQNGNSLSFSGYKGTFSPFGIGDPADPLPVELLYFNGTCQPQGLDFRWATAAEVNSKSFTLEHSANLVEWHALHTQPSAGFSSSQKEYSTQLPHQPHLGPYFRLHQEDFDGKFERFAPLHLECSETSGSGLLLYPNPGHDAVWVSGIAGTLDWEIFDARGRRLRSGKLNMDETPQQLPTQGLPAGMYLFQTPNARLPLMLQD